MAKKTFGVILTVAVMMVCLAIPSAASKVSSGTYKVSLQGKYLDSQFSQRAINKIRANNSTKSTGNVTLSYGAGKTLTDFSWNRTGSYDLTTSYVYSKQIRSFGGICTFRTK
ncbi:MAG: hypothetical protein IKW88_01875 [Clostridiales bacterium]|nr:hypothetical protein [Clostridiales bacterium]